jgi:hypothetical protein
MPLPPVVVYMDDYMQGDVYIIVLYDGHERYTWPRNVTWKETNGTRCFKQVKKEWMKTMLFVGDQTIVSVLNNIK